MDKVWLYEYENDEEFYARFIHIRVGDRDVLVFNYTPEDRKLAEQIANLMGEPERFVGSSVEWGDFDADADADANADAGT